MLTNLRTDLEQLQKEREAGMCLVDVLLLTCLAFTKHNGECETDTSVNDVVSLICLWLQRCGNF